MQHLIDPAYPLYDAHWEHDACGLVRDSNLR